MVSRRHCFFSYKKKGQIRKKDTTFFELKRQSLGSAVVCHPFSFTGLPWPSGSGHSAEAGSVVVALAISYLRPLDGADDGERRRAELISGDRRLQRLKTPE